MINRLKDFLGEPEERKPEEDYWEIETTAGWFYVSRETARALVARLDRLCRARWLTFRDIFGSEVWVRSNSVTRVSECTDTQRAAGRAFRRERRREEKSDRRPWEDDD
jgi:hypothetical protein